MKKYFAVYIVVVFLCTLSAGCNNKRAADSLDGSKSTGVTPVNSDTSQNIALNEDLQSIIHKDNFLKSKDGHDFQVTSWKFAKAYLSGNVNLAKGFVINPELKLHFYNTENLFSNIEFMILKLSSKNIEDDYVNAEYELQLKGEDSYTYLFIEMKKIDNEWKVQYFGLEK